MPIIFNVKIAIGVHAASGLAAAVSSYQLPARAYASKAITKAKRNSYKCIMRTPTSDQHFKDKIVHIILEILRYVVLFQQDSLAAVTWYTLVTSLPCDMIQPHI